MDNVNAVCIDCKTLFTVIDDENPGEDRCRDCQTQYRIKQADKMHKTGKFVNYLTKKYTYDDTWFLENGD